MKMKKEIRKKWVKALRGGKYKQCRGKLKKSNKDGAQSFCCLGVLCDLYVKSHSKVKWTGRNTILGEGGSLPNGVMN